MTNGDSALDSCAQFLAVAEHRLIPSRVQSTGHVLHKAGHQLVWSPACKDQVVAGHAGVGVVSLGGAPLASPTFATSEFQDFCWLGMALRVTLPTGKGREVHLFVIHGYQGGGGL